MKAVHGAFFVEEGPVAAGQRQWTAEDVARLRGDRPHVMTSSGPIYINTPEHVQIMQTLRAAKEGLARKIEATRANYEATKRHAESVRRVPR